MVLDASSIAYWLTGAICLLLAARAVPGPEARLVRAQVLAWRIIGGLLLLIGFVRPFEVYSSFSAALRQSAMTEGWYGERVNHQLDLLIAGSVVAAVAAAFILFETRRWHLSTRLALIATLYLMATFVINVVTLHAIDALFSMRLIGIPLRWTVDLAGLAAVVLAALWFRSRTRRPPPRRNGR